MGVIILNSSEHRELASRFVDFPASTAGKDISDEYTET
jgi:ABC-type molybdate transport system substrate-binding protein